MSRILTGIEADCHSFMSKPRSHESSKYLSG